MSAASAGSSAGATRPGSKCFVIDEWVFHDLAGDNGEDRQKEAVNFLDHLRRICDHMAAPRRSPWATKLCGFVAHADRSPALVGLRDFVRALLFDAAKVRLVEPTELLPLQQPVAACIPAKDTYLVQVTCALAASALVTTDGPLLDACAKAGVRAVARDDFLRGYPPADVR